MKDLKLKDLVMEHYRMVYEIKVDGVTVRVWKPRTMGKLPTHAMKSEIEHRADDARRYAAIEQSRKVQWWTGNPDYGIWDAQIVRRFDPKKMELDLFFAALLIRPFSQQAFEWYREHSMVYDPIARMVMMWDSREFDKAHGYDVSYGEYTNQKQVDGYIYSGKKWDGSSKPVDDPAFDPCFTDDECQDGLVIKFRTKDGNIESETSWPPSKENLEKVQTCIKPTLTNYLSFTHEHPEVKEIHYFTEFTEWDADSDDVQSN